MVKKDHDLAAELTELSREARKAKARRAERAEDLLALIERRKRDITEAFYDIGLALKELNDERLHLALDYTSFKEMLEARKVMGHSKAQELIAIAGKTLKTHALEMGKEKSYALVLYARKTRSVDTPDSLYRANAMIDGVPVREATAEHIEQAARKLDPPAGKARRADPRASAAERAARHAQAFLRKRGAAGARAVARRRRQGWVVEVSLPVDEAERLG